MYHLARPPCLPRCRADPADKWRRLAAVNSGILRRHFQDLTKALLFPLLPLFSPAAPPPPTLSQTADPKGARGGWLGQGRAVPGLSGA